MTEQKILDRITLDPKIMTGKPVISGTRLTVEFVLNLLAHGETIESITQEYPGVTIDDIHACLLFASRSLESTDFLLLTAEQG